VKSTMEKEGRLSTVQPDWNGRCAGSSVPSGRPQRSIGASVEIVVETGSGICPEQDGPEQGAGRRGDGLTGMPGPKSRPVINSSRDVSVAALCKSRVECAR
jgi:hypothetical protein